MRRSWPCYDVSFPGLERRIAGGYHAVTSEGLTGRCRGALGERALLGSRGAGREAGRATLDDGSEIEPRCVIDGRGFPAARFMNAGFQKFLGLEVALAADHGLEAPLLMDATVPQEGGFRFVYVLPFAAADGARRGHLLRDDARPRAGRARAQRIGA